jgi:hypothetical protein
VLTFDQLRVSEFAVAMPRGDRSLGGLTMMTRLQLYWGVGGTT